MSIARVLHVGSQSSQEGPNNDSHVTFLKDPGNILACSVGLWSWYFECSKIIIFVEAYLVFAELSMEQIQDIKFNKFTYLRATETPHCHIERATLSLNLAWVLAESKVFSGVPYDGLLLPVTVTNDLAKVIALFKALLPMLRDRLQQYQTLWMFYSCYLGRCRSIEVSFECIPIVRVSYIT